MSKEKSRFTEPNDESTPPPYNRDLDPDNATSPLDFDERLKEGERKFYPEGGPEEPPVEEEEESKADEEESR